MASKKKHAKTRKPRRPATYKTLVVEADEVYPTATPCLVLLGQGILSNVDVRANLYLLGVLACSFLGEQLLAYQNYIYTAAENNIFNIYFVKFGWAWTMSLVAPFTLMTGFSLGGARGVIVGVFRLAVATAVWYGATTMFDAIKTTSASNFDLSGHAFILVFGLIFMIEESKAYQQWDSIYDNLLRSKTTFEESPALRWLRTCMCWLTLPLRINLLLLALLSVLWDVMLFSTLLFYHTWDEKLYAVVLALFAWLVLYHGLYTLPPPPSLFSPRLLGQATILRIQQLRSEERY